MSTAWGRIGFGVAVLAAVCGIGIVGYEMAGWSWIDAAYMVVITIFGVGYGEVHSINTPELRLFTMFLIVSGCSALIYILGGIFSLITEGELNRVMGKRKMTQQLQKLSDHVIVCGYGRLGHVLARDFQQSGTPFVIVDIDEARIEEAQDAGLLALAGDASDEATLTEAGIERARALTTVLPNDAVNVFITLTARTMNKEMTIIARAETPSTEPKLKQAGANEVVLPANIGATRIAHMITRPTVLEYFKKFNLDNLRAELNSIGVLIDELAIPSGSRLDGLTVGTLESTNDGGFMVVAVQRNDGQMIKNPQRTYRLSIGERLLLMGHEEDVPGLVEKYSLVELEGDPDDARPAAV